MSSTIQLRDYQEVAVSEIRAEFREKNMPVLFVLPTGGGKCLGAGTPILMHDGSIKPVEQVGVGDLLMGPDSAPRRVLSLARGREQLYRVTPTKGDAYVVNESHILSLRSSTRGVIKNISVREYLNEPEHWRIRNLGWRVPGVLRGDLSYELSQIKVDPIGEGDYFGFEIDGDHLFMLGDFTVTHNTFTFSYIASSAAEKGRGVCIIVHRKELLLQASASLAALGIDHGLISPFFTPKPRALVQVASVDTLLSRLKKWMQQCDAAEKAGRAKPPIPYQFGLLIFDEAHHVVDGNKWGRAFEQLSRPPMLGVTATPVRTDGKGLGEHAGGVFKAMVLGPSVKELIGRGMLLNPIVYTSLDAPETDDVKTQRDGGDNLQALAERIDKPKITGDAVEHYAKICPGARAIVFCCNITHAKHVVEAFNAKGFRFELLVGAPEMSDAERTAVNKRLRKGEIHGAVTVDLVSEGYDLPDLECCIMLRSTASEALFLQQVGRVMRPSPGKTICWLLDHVANVGRLLDGQFKRKHGLPDEEREWTLDGRKKRKGKKKAEDEVTIELQQCPKCYVVHDPAPECPKCGHVYPPKPGGRGIEQVEGELQQITPEMQAQIAEQDRQRQRSAQAAAKSVEDMMEQLGYTEKRAQAIVKAREEKSALRTSLIFDMQAWQKKTGQAPFQAFGIYLSDLKAYKPKALKELRERFDAHCAQHEGRQASILDRPGDDNDFGDFMRDALAPNNGSNAAF